MAQITYIQHERVNTDRYSSHAYHGWVHLVCNECRDGDELPLLILSTLSNPSFTTMVAVITRHERLSHSVHSPVKS